MKLARLFNTSVPASVTTKALPETYARTREAAPSVSSFVTVQSLVSFPGASFVVAILTQAIRSALSARNSTLLPLVISLIVGGIIFLISINDKNSTSRPTSASDWAIAVFIGLVNAILLYMAAIGAIQTVTGNAPTPVARP
jgi:predicted phage tail protein